MIAALHLLGRQVVQAVTNTPAATAEIDVSQALILAVLWIHYASMVFLYAAQLMRVYLYRYRGVQLPPATNPPA